MEERVIVEGLGERELLSLSKRSDKTVPIES